MITVTSKNNQLFKECRKLAQKKYRDLSGKFLAEGEILVCEAFSCNLDIDALIVREGAQYTDINDFDEGLTARLGTDAAGRLSGQIGKAFVFSPELFGEICQTETSQGIIAVVNKRELSREDFISRIGPGDDILIMDRLQDPGNIGTILRTAEGAGYSACVAVKGTGDIYSPKVLRAGAGSIFRLPVIYVDDGEAAASLASDAGKRLAVTCVDGGVPYYMQDLSGDVALVIGNEGGGVSDVLMDCADIKITIPMSGELESLNAAVAAAILMFERVRK